MVNIWNHLPNIRKSNRTIFSTFSKANTHRIKRQPSEGLLLGCAPEPKGGLREAGITPASPTLQVKQECQSQAAEPGCWLPPGSLLSPLPPDPLPPQPPPLPQNSSIAEKPLPNVLGRSSQHASCWVSKASRQKAQLGMLTQLSQLDMNTFPWASPSLHCLAAYQGCRWWLVKMGSLTCPPKYLGLFRNLK